MRRAKSKTKGWYNGHKTGALARGIQFELTYTEWLKIWRDSGHFHERGRRGHEYVMARYGDKGPYAVGNVKIITQSENLSEGHLGMTFSDEARAKMSARSKGRIRSKEYRKALSESLKGKVKSQEHRQALSKSIQAAQARMRAEGRHIGRPKKNDQP